MKQPKQQNDYEKAWSDNGKSDDSNGDEKTAMVISQPPRVVPLVKSKPPQTEEESNAGWDKIFQEDGNITGAVNKFFGTPAAKQYEERQKNKKPKPGDR